MKITETIYRGIVGDTFIKDQHTTCNINDDHVLCNCVNVLTHQLFKHIYVYIVYRIPQHIIDLCRTRNGNLDACECLCPVTNSIKWILRVIDLVRFVFAPFAPAHAHSRH